MIPLSKGQKAARRAITRDRIARQRIVASRRNRAGPRRPARKTKAKGNFRNSNGVGRVRVQGVSAPAAVSIKGMRVGLSDVMRHNISWLAGYIYVGNGTLGATNSVYYMDVTKTDCFTSPVPILAAQTGTPAVGASYIQDVEKHYARKRINSQKLTLLPLFPSTANSMTTIVAPIRGSQSADDTTATVGTGAGLSYTNVLSMTGSKQVASWEQLDLDLTTYIAGGSGSRQNEFSIDSASGVGTTVGQVGSLISPSMIAVSGNNSTAGLQGTTTHAIVISQNIDLLDFLGGQTPLEPVSFHGDDEKRTVFTSTAHNSSQIDLDEEYQTYLDFKEHHAKNQREIKEPSSEIDEDYASVPSTTILNGTIKLNPRALEFNPAKIDSGIILPKSESFIGQVRDLISARNLERK